MSSTSTLSEQIVESVHTGKDPAVLDVVEALASTLTAAEINILDGVTATASEINALASATSANATTGKAAILGTSGALTVASTLTLGSTALTATAAELNARNAAASRFVVIPDATPYTVLAADSGKKHIISEQTSTITINLPVISTGMEYEFCMGGVATEAQNWIFVATTPSFWNGGVVWQDQDSATDNTEPVYGNGTSHLTFTVVTPNAGTVIRAYAPGGGEWLLSGTAVSASTPTMA